jgi:hypothetical protein
MSSSINAAVTTPLIISTFESVSDKELLPLLQNKAIFNNPLPIWQQLSQEKRMGMWALYGEKLSADEQLDIIVKYSQASAAQASAASSAAHGPASSSTATPNKKRKLAEAQAAAQQATATPTENATKRPVTCRLCKSANHNMRTCPTYCYNCTKHERNNKHKAKECKFCALCNKEGHKATTCPNKPASIDVSVAAPTATAEVVPVAVAAPVPEFNLVLPTITATAAVAGTSSFATSPMTGDLTPIQHVSSDDDDDDDDDDDE